MFDQHIFNRYIFFRAMHVGDHDGIIQNKKKVTVHRQRTLENWCQMDFVMLDFSELLS